MKSKFILVVITTLAILFVSCTPQANPNTTPSPSPTGTNATGGPTETPDGDQDTTTTASIVNDAAAFESAIGTNGTWIICLLNDLTIEKDLVLDGEYKNGKKDADGKDIIQRKIALYTQDENRNVTARFTLTAPKLTINSPMARIQSGTFKGDLYVNAKNFELVDTTIDGNIYFTNDEAKNTFKMDEKSKVNGVQELRK